MVPPKDGTISTSKAKAKIVVKKKKHHSRLKPRRQALVQFPARRGLPGIKPLATAVVEEKEKEDVSGATSAFDDDDNDAVLFANLACDTLLAIQSLQRSNETSLEIPLAGGSTIRGVLECQIYERFGDSSQQINQEFDELLKTNTLRQLCSSFQHSADRVVTVFILAEDYVRALRAIANGDEYGKVVVDWFVEQLNQWTKSRLAVVDFEDAWKNNADCVGTASKAMRWLQDHQILLAASLDHESYQLWLPEWGSAVLPAFFKATTSSLAFLKSSSYKERSVLSVVRRLSSSPIPVTNVLIPWLVAQGHVQRVERPSGDFVKLVIDS